MLRLTAERAGLSDGQRILELGCGWGSLTLWMAEHFPTAHITAVTNSETQAAHIRAQGFDNVEVVKCDVNDLAPRDTFDRIVSVEMFEHVRNYHELFGRIETWLRDDGKLFVHVFSHKNLPYLFESDGAGDWMAREFFTGGTMPSQDFLPRFARGLRVEKEWRINGTHYARTLEHWLDQLDTNRKMLHTRFAGDLGARAARVTLQRWRMFIMACAELFAFQGGNEWGVSHYRFGKGEKA
jgi:cyclopropane-fatty-acyl-phospholipid synthase